MNAPHCTYLQQLLRCNVQATGIVALAHDDSGASSDQRPPTGRPAADRLGSSYGAHLFN